MGLVYLAVRADDEYRKQVAIKLIKPGLGTEAIVRRFRHERQILSELDHPNIAKLLDGGTMADGLSYFIMDYVEGLPIDRYCNTHQLSIVERLKLFRTVCSAVQYAHDNQIVHRDIKPDNILVTADGIPKLLDFGIAKLLDPEPVRAPAESTILGLRPMTLEYASPEQVRGETITPASDIYSLGVLLYELLTGHRPYRARTLTPQVIERVICEEMPEKPSTAMGRIEELPGAEDAQPMRVTPESVSSRRDRRPDGLRRQLRGDLDTIVLMALRKEPERRYASAEQFSEDIRRYQEGRPVMVRKDTLWYRTGKFVKRNQASVITAALGLAVILGLIGLLFTPLARRAPIPGKAPFSLAVLPLENLNHDPEQEHLADGITETLMADLAQIRALHVTSRTSVIRHKKDRSPRSQVARAWNVDALVEGSVLRSGDQIQIIVQLIQATTDRPLWTQRYERNVGDIPVLAREVVRDLVRGLGVQLTQPEQARLRAARAVPREAYLAYSMGRYFWNRRKLEDLKKGIQYFEKSIAIDPNYALAYVGLADSYILLFDFGVAPNEAFPKGKEAALKALTLNDQLAEAYASLGFLRMQQDWDWTGAERDFQRALDINPNYPTAHQWYALYLARMNRLSEVMTEIHRAQEMDPHSLIINSAVGLHLYLARRYDEAIAQEKKVLEMDPGFARAHIVLGRAYAQKGLYKEALAHLHKAKSLSSARAAVIEALGYVYALAGMKTEALRALGELQDIAQRRYVSPFSVALIYAGLGEKDQAFAWLEKATAEHAVLPVGIREGPFFDPLRSDPRFTKLMRRVGLPP